MVFSYKEKIIIEYLRLKYGATRIVNDHTKHDWNVNGVNKLEKY